MTTISMQCDHAIDARRLREGKVITTSTRRPRDCSANVKREADHIEVVPHVLRFAYFLPASAGARNLQKLASSWRASPAVPDRNLSVSALQKIDEARRSG